MAWRKHCFGSRIPVSTGAYRVFTKSAPAALLGGPAWLSFSKPVSLGGLPPYTAAGC